MPKHEWGGVTTMRLVGCAIVLFLGCYSLHAGIVDTTVRVIASAFFSVVTTSVFYVLARAVREDREER